MTETGTTARTKRGAGGATVRLRGGGHVAPLRAEALRGAPPPPGRAAPLPQVAGPRRNAAPMPRACKGPGPSSVPGILSPRKVTVKCARYARVLRMAQAPHLTVTFPGKTSAPIGRTGQSETCPGSSRATYGPV